MSVVLPGVPDAAMHLHVLQGHPLISGQRMSGRHGRGYLGLRTIGTSRVPGSGDCEFAVDKHVRAVMFDCLKRADRSAELLAAGGVSRRHLGARAQPPTRVGVGPWEKS